VRRVVMKDAASAELFKTKLEAMKATGIFRDTVPGADPKKPVVIDVNFLVSGNYLLVIGSREWVTQYVEAIRLMGYLFERPRAHLQLSLRVVQITGPANQNVIQMSETVRALVDAQRDEVVRTFGDLDDYLTARMKQRTPAEREVYEAARELLPSLGTGSRPQTVPELLVMMMLERSSPAPSSTLLEDAARAEQVAADSALLELPRVLTRLVRDPRMEEKAAVEQIQAPLTNWKKAVTSAREWCTHYADELGKSKEGFGLKAFREAIQQPNIPLPAWVARRLSRSLETTERLFPHLVRQHTENSLRELARRFDAALDRAGKIEQTLAKGEAPPASEKKSDKKSDKGADQAAERAQVAAEALATSRNRNLLALKSLSEELIPAPMALFESVASVADESAPRPEQLVQMLREYTAERRKLDIRLSDDDLQSGSINYAKLQTLEAGLNLWLRRVSEAMARSLEQHFYRRYANELRLLANKELGSGNDRTILKETHINEVPDIARDLLLADTGVNIFVSNSISLQFAPDTTNTVTAQVQSSLPSKMGILERAQQAKDAATTMSAISAMFPAINGESIVKALMAGGQAVPVQGGINLSAMPSIGVDASTVTLSLTANQTLQPNTDKIADRVTNHAINNATITALSYEPMVLSTLASNMSYYEKTGGVPILRKVPFLKDALKDIPLAPFKEGSRQKGVYQSSVLILEPVVIPTIEDLVRFHSGWRDDTMGPKVTVKDEEGDFLLPTAPTGVIVPKAPAAPPVPAPAPAGK